MMISKLRVVLEQTTLIMVFLCTCSAFASGNGTDVAEIIATGTDATPIKQEPPIYPIRALREGTEGWVVLSFSVLEDGTTADIIVLNASIEGYFGKAAIRAVSGWTYAPATKNGEPVIQYNKRARSTFRITDMGDGVTKSFRRNFRNATKAIGEGDLEKAESLIAILDSNKKRLLSEVFYLDILKSSYYSEKDDNKATLKYLGRVLTIADEVATKNMYIALLKQAVVENARDAIIETHCNISVHRWKLTRIWWRMIHYAIL